MSLENDKTLATMVAREIDRHARLAVLRFLDQGPGRLNDQILLDLLAATGHPLTADHFDELLAGLVRDGFLTTQPFDDVTLVNLTLEGQEVATGRRRHEGIAQPPLRRSSRSGQ
ncbi:hypothetical protein [Rhodoferax sp.]|uniref:VpaChn25_0724 family phage protein n=1 Tax=Rhodoferax sp. TaxID=50421 RepID=UPI002753DD7B|nr:hypothetical protein [Rhodoferax sp.]